MNKGRLSTSRLSTPRTTLREESKSEKIRTPPIATLETIDYPNEDKYIGTLKDNKKEGKGLYLLTYRHTIL